MHMGATDSSTDALQLQGPSLKALGGLALLVVAVPTAVTALALQVSSQRSGWSAATVVAAVALCSLAAFAALAWASSRRSLTLTQQGLELRSGFNALKLLSTEIDIGGIRVIDPDRENGYRIAWRTNGIAFPGFQSGWFKSKAGGTLFVVRSGSDCVVVPCRIGFDLLLGSDRAADLAASLRARLICV